VHVEFRVLGPLEVLKGSGPVALGGSKPRAVVAVLLLSPNEPVHPERLAVALWGDEVPASAVKTVQVYVSRLRKAFGDAERLVTTPAGYRLSVHAGELDAERFATLVDDGRRALAAARPEQAAAKLRAALALWRGPPLADLAFEPFAQAAIARLEEQRMTAVELRVDADLELGAHAELVGELRQLAGAHPTRERLAGQLMLALYRCGQQTAALEVFRTTRAALVAEVGLEPGPQLRRLEQSILRQDAALEQRPPASELPVQLDAANAPPLEGRDGELEWLRDRWERARAGRCAVVALTGAPGIGKTRLAAELAGEVHEQGASVLYFWGEPPAGALDRARAGPTLVVVEDASTALLAEAIDGRADDPLLVLVIAREPLGPLPAGDALGLGPLDAAAVRAIAGCYAPGVPLDDVPAERLLAAAAGVPARVHEVAGQWARREAARRVSAAAARTATRRGELREVEHELADDVVELQATRDRAAIEDDVDDPVVCPFKGLASFDAVDAAYFFGRERLVAELVARLVGAPLLAVVGPSGSGKSSVLRAGLLPALAAGVLPGSEHWAQLLIRPGEHPRRELARATGELDGGRFVVAVDQFEETFTTCADEHERVAFIGELASLARRSSGQGVVVLAIRADYYGRCAAYPALSELLAADHVLVGPMRRDELRRAVEGPARRVGLRVEPALTEALLADVEDEPGALPLLSTALLELWQQRDGRHLRHAAYEHTGGVRGAVARLAEDAYARLEPARRRVARDLVMRLVGLGADGTVERRRVPADAFTGTDVQGVLALFTDRRLLTVGAGTVEIAHEALLREWPRLVDWIDESRAGLRLHRALAGAAAEWRRLQRDDGALYRGTRLTETLEWSDAKSPSLTELEREFLTASETASDRERITRRRRLRLTGAAVAVLAAAVVAIVLTVFFADREHDIAASRDLATKSATLVSSDPGLALAVAREALDRRDTEQARNALRQATLAHRATRVVRVHGGIVFGLALSPDGRLAATAGDDGRVRIWSRASGRGVGEVGGFGDEVRAVSFSPDGTRIAAAARNGEIAVAPARGGARDVLARLRGDYAVSLDFGDDGAIAAGTDSGRVALLRPGDRTPRDIGPRHDGPVFDVRFDPGGRRVVSAGADGIARIAAIAGASHIDLEHVAGQLVLAACFSPDGTRVATADEAGVVRLWDAADGRLRSRIPVADTPIASLRFAGDGRRLVAGGFDGVIRIVDLPARAVLAELRGHAGPARADVVRGGDAIVSVGEEDGTLRTWQPGAASVVGRPGTAPVFSRDGRLVVAGSVGGAIFVWNPATGRQRTLDGGDASSFPRFSPDGRTIVSASDDDTVMLWDVATERKTVVPTLGGQKLTAAIDPSGTRIAIGGTTRLVIQRLDGSRRVRLRASRTRVNAVAFSPDGRHLLTGGDDGVARIYSARDGRLERVLEGHEGTVRDVAYGDGGRLIATAGSDGTVRVTPSSGGDAVILVGHESAVNTAAFNRAGDRVVSAGDDGTVRVWDVRGGEALVVLERYAGAATGADFGAGRTVVSAGDGVMRATTCEVCGSIEDVLRVAGTRAQHDLSAAERRRLLSG
jgi:WD40 repeat protein/DNA-binding SARP family transcriptional activator/uncharacterized protein YbaA (DUF1428 family)